MSHVRDMESVTIAVSVCVTVCPESRSHPVPDTVAHFANAILKPATRQMASCVQVSNLVHIHGIGDE